ncbi:hypothetical protein EJB05_12999, partial [Eragrostis curvula]
MAAAAARGAGTEAAAKEIDKKVELMKEVRAHEVAISELNSLPPSRGNKAIVERNLLPNDADASLTLIELVCLGLQQPVYQKAGNIFFRKSIQSVVTAEQKQLDLAKARLNKLDQA